MLKIPVLNRAGEIVFKADAGEAARMLALGQATSTSDGRCLRLTGFTSEKEHSGRTRTSRGGILASCGRSQQYTTSERGQVTGFKRIYPEDRDIFVTAVLDAIVEQARRADSSREQKRRGGSRRRLPAGVCLLSGESRGRRLETIGAGRRGREGRAMTIGGLKAQISGLDDALEIEIIVTYEDDDGDEVERGCDLRAIEKRLDPDTAREYARFDCGDA